MKNAEQKSLLMEHFYPFLGILFAGSSFLLMGFGFKPYESIVIGLWIAGIAFFIRQVVRFMKNEPAPKKEEKSVLMDQTPKKYTPPALPRVSKDFSPMPPAGDKRYPPPSPFIKPPK
ncbi:MAG TPA: hypothetical protein VKP61_03960 [Candidatus Acidoferrum sp.]|nr:hypothetical protein [Candidatus Acidoferrum sp.]